MIRGFLLLLVMTLFFVGNDAGATQRRSMVSIVEEW
jgi:hypothetical protein